MSVDSNLRDELGNHLSDTEIAQFEDGELCLFMDEPKYAFFRLTDSGFQRADVVRDLSPDNDAAMRIYNDVYGTTANEILDRARKQNDIEAYPVEVGFGDV